MTAKAESRYQRLLQVAADMRWRDATAAANFTYTASVAAVETITPRASQGSIRITKHLARFDCVQLSSIPSSQAQHIMYTARHHCHGSTSQPTAPAGATRIIDVRFSC